MHQRRNRVGGRRPAALEAPGAAIAVVLQLGPDRLGDGIAAAQGRQGAGQRPITGVPFVEQLLPQRSVAEVPVSEPAKRLHRLPGDRRLQIGGR